MRILNNQALIAGPVDDISLNLGDQALVLGAIHRLGNIGKIFLLTSRESDISFLAGFKNLEVIFIPVRGSFFLYFKDVFFLLFFFLPRLFFRFTEFNFIGADVIDGRHGKLARSTRILLRYSFLIAKKLKILSFSFSYSQSTSIHKLLDGIKFSTHFFPRDIVSLENLKKEFGNQIEVSLMRDLSFLVPKNCPVDNNHDIFSWINFQRNLAKKVVIFCPANRASIKDISYFIERSTGAFNSLGDNFSTIVICHDLRDEGLKIAEDVYEKLNHSKYLFKEKNTVLARSVIGKSDFVYSCLMHCALGAVANDVPVVFLDYHGKGLPIFNSFNLEHSLVQSEHIFIDKIRKEFLNRGRKLRKSKNKQ